MHYQVDNGVIAKYYLAGATRIAMRKNGTLYYLVGDHASTMLSTSASTALSTSLGSTSLTLNASGTKIAELRYKAWGETRYTSGTTYTPYQFREAPCKGTAQRNETSLGLYFYREASRRDNARWPRSVPKAQRRGYDPSLGHFTSADTIVPTQTQGVQAWDRYAYTNNNPIRSTDPTGHWRVEDPGSKRGCSDPFYCANGQPYVRAIRPHSTRPHSASGMTQQSQSSQWALPPLVNPRFGLPRLTVFDNGLYASPFGVRVSTQPSVTIQTGSPLTLGSDGVVIFSGQYGNLSTRLTVNSERITGFGIAAVDRVAGSITESTGIMVAPDQLSVTFTSSVTVNNVNVTVPTTVEARYNPLTLAVIGSASYATSVVLSFGTTSSAGYTACRAWAIC